jgi:hypothetical protein
MAATRTHFTFRIVMWTADGESIVVDRGQHSEQRSARALAQPRILANRTGKCRLVSAASPKNAGSTPSKPMACGQRPEFHCVNVPPGTRAYLGSFLHVSAIIF